MKENQPPDKFVVSYMKAVSSACSSLGHDDLVAHLKAKGWALVQSEPGRSSIWGLDWRGERAELLVPIDRTYRDHGRRMFEAIGWLAAIEDRSMAEVLAGLQGPCEARTARGRVVQLQTRDEKGPPAGPIVLSTVVDGQPRKVTIDLPEAEHQKAIDADKRGLEVSCHGALTKSGPSWSLQSPGPIVVLGDD